MRERRRRWATFPGRWNTDFAKSTAIVVLHLDSSCPEPSGAQGELWHSMPRESREESISSMKLAGRNQRRTVRLLSAAGLVNG